MSDAVFGLNFHIGRLIPKLGRYGTPHENHMSLVYDNLQFKYRKMVL